jgi:hypothetical protein
MLFFDKIKKFLKIIIFIFLSSVFYFLALCLFENDWASTTALYISFIALLNPIILKYFFPPVLIFKIKKVNNLPQQDFFKNEENINWYNLSIENHGFLSAKNIQIKIRKNSEREWINLVRPFANDLAKQGLDCFKITLSSKESEDFNIGFIFKNKSEEYNKDIFYLYTNISPYMEVSSNSEAFDLKIVGENMDALFYKLEIKHDDFDNFNKDNIKLKQWKLFIS